MNGVAAGSSRPPSAAGGGGGRERTRLSAQPRNYQELEMQRRNSTSPPKGLGRGESDDAAPRAGQGVWQISLPSRVVLPTFHEVPAACDFE